MKLTDDEIPNRCSIIYLRGGAQRRRDKVLPFPPDDRRVRTRRIPPGLFFGIVFLVLVSPSSSPSFWGGGLFVRHVVVAGVGVGVRHCVKMSLSLSREGRRKVTTEKGEFMQKKRGKKIFKKKKQNKKERERPKDSSHHSLFSLCLFCVRESKDDENTGKEERFATRGVRR